MVAFKRLKRNCGLSLSFLSRFLDFFERQENQFWGESQKFICRLFLQPANLWARFEQTWETWTFGQRQKAELRLREASSAWRWIFKRTKRLTKLILKIKTFLRILSGLIELVLKMWKNFSKSNQIHLKSREKISEFRERENLIPRSFLTQDFVATTVAS